MPQRHTPMELGDGTGRRVCLRCYKPFKPRNHITVFCSSRCQKSYSHIHREVRRKVKRQELRDIDPLGQQLRDKLMSRGPDDDAEDDDESHEHQVLVGQRVQMQLRRSLRTSGH